MNLRNPAIAALVAAAAVLAIVSAAGCPKSGPDWRVIQLYGGETSVALLRNADRVQAFRLGPPANGAKTPAPEVHAGPFPADGQRVELTTPLAAELSSILLDADTYNWQRMRNTDFRPQIGLWFVRGSYVLEVAVDFESGRIWAYGGGQVLGARDIASGRDRVLAVAKAAFPGDAAIQGLR
jgi:hypothetical protein